MMSEGKLLLTLHVLIFFFAENTNMTEKSAVQILQENKIKFNPQELLWAIELHDAGLDEMVKNFAKDKPLFATQLIFLERGNESGGMTHIWSRHGADFRNMCGVVNEAEAIAYIKRYISMGHNATYGYKIFKDRGFAIVYQIHENLFLHVAIGFNGFIVSAYLRPESNQAEEFDY